MKNILHALCLIMPLAVSNLFAQADPSTLLATEPSTSEVHHVGVRNYYGKYSPIGSKEASVTANEYCAFLNSNGEALNIQKDDHGQLSSSNFCESSYMNCVGSNPWRGVWGEHQTIKKDDCITRHNTYHYRYSVIPGRGEFIIDSVTNAYIADEFSAWRRKNPTAQELCDYINDRVEGLIQEAATIKSRFPEVSQGVFEAADLMGQVSHNFEGKLQSEVRDEYNRPILNFSNGSNQEALHATVVEGMEYYRPTTIQWRSVDSQN